MSMTLPQQNKRQSLLTNPTSVQLLTAPQKEENVLELNDSAALMDSSEQARQATHVLAEAMISACYIYDADFLDL